MKIILTLATAAVLSILMTACSNETTSTSTSNVDSTSVPADNTGSGISGGDVNTIDTTGTGAQPTQPAKGDTSMMMR